MTNTTKQRQAARCPDWLAGYEFEIRHANGDLKGAQSIIDLLNAKGASLKVFEAPAAADPAKYHPDATGFPVVTWRSTEWFRSGSSVHAMQPNKGPDKLLDSQIAVETLLFQAEAAGEVRRALAPHAVEAVTARFEKRAGNNPRTGLTLFYEWDSAKGQWTETTDYEWTASMSGEVVAIGPRRLRFVDVFRDKATAKLVMRVDMPPEKMMRGWRRKLAAWLLAKE